MNNRDKQTEGYLTLIIVLGILLALVTVGLATKVQQIKPITIEQIVEEGLNERN